MSGTTGYWYSANDTKKLPYICKVPPVDDYGGPPCPSGTVTLMEPVLHAEVRANSMGRSSNSVQGHKWSAGIDSRRNGEQFPDQYAHWNAVYLVLARRYELFWHVALDRPDSLQLYKLGIL